MERLVTGTVFNPDRACSWERWLFLPVTVRMAYFRRADSWRSTKNSSVRPREAARTEPGTLFSIASTGGEKLLHSFTTEEGVKLVWSLIVVNGALYGATFAGGKFGAGTAFRATVDGQVKVLHNFGSGGMGWCEAVQRLYQRQWHALRNHRRRRHARCRDGVQDDARREGDGALQLRWRGQWDARPSRRLRRRRACYTERRSAARREAATHSGMIFRITPGGTETTLHAFGGGKGGGNPYGGLGVVWKTSMAQRRMTVTIEPVWCIR